MNGSGRWQDIFREGQRADRFYIIHQGRGALETFVPRSGSTTVQTIRGATRGAGVGGMNTAEIASPDA